MGFFGNYKEDERDEKRNNAITEKNRSAAQKTVSENIDKTRKQFSEVGDVLELTNDKYDAYGEVLKPVLGYETLSFNADYLGFYTVDNIDSHISGYSGTIDSSGNVSLSPNYSSTRFKTTETKDQTYRENLVIKTVKKGSKDVVKRLENKFFSEGGDMYLTWKKGNTIEGSDERLPDKMWITQRALAVANLIFTICLFAALNLIVNTVTYVVDEDISALYLGLPLFAIIIFYVIIGQVLKKCKRDVKTYYSIKDSMSSGFLAVIIILAVFSFIECMFSWSMEEYSAVNYIVSLVIELVALVVSIIFLVRCANKNDKNKYACMFRIVGDSSKLAELEKLSSEIMSYTVKCKVQGNFGGPYFIQQAMIQE